MLSWISIIGCARTFSPFLKFSRLDQHASKKISTTSLYDAEGNNCVTILKIFTPRPAPFRSPKISRLTHARSCASEVYVCNLTSHSSVTRCVIIDLATSWHVQTWYSVMLQKLPPPHTHTLHTYTHPTSSPSPPPSCTYAVWARCRWLESCNVRLYPSPAGCSSGRHSCRLAAAAACGPAVAAAGRGPTMCASMEV